LLTQKGNLKVFFLGGQSDRIQDIEHETNDTQQAVDDHDSTNDGSKIWIALLQAYPIPCWAAFTLHFELENDLFQPHTLLRASVSKPSNCPTQNTALSCFPAAESSSVPAPGWRTFAV
jgi:hypothetical protein